MYYLCAVYCTSRGGLKARQGCSDSLASAFAFFLCKATCEAVFTIAPRNQSSVFNLNFRISNLQPPTSSIKLRLKLNDHNHLLRTTACRSLLHLSKLCFSTCILAHTSLAGLQARHSTAVAPHLLFPRTLEPRSIAYKQEQSKAGQAFLSLW